MNDMQSLTDVVNDKSWPKSPITANVGDLFRVCRVYATEMILLRDALKKTRRITKKDIMQHFGVRGPDISRVDVTHLLSPEVREYVKQKRRIENHKKVPKRCRQ